MLKAVIIGWGGISRSHKMSYAALAREGKVHLSAAYDINPDAFTQKTEINIQTEETGNKEDIRFYTDLDEMLVKENPDYVDICAPTYVHKELACRVLRAGYHVLSEKPMALSSADGEEMLAAAEESGKHLMVAQCIRFRPEMKYLKAAIEAGRYGKVLSAFFFRLSTMPTWGYENWFADPRRSGGCLTDMHIHDIDLARYLFGEPTAVSCRASSSFSCFDSVHSSLFFKDVPVTAIGDWTMKGVPFSAGCKISFEHATALYEKELTIYPEEGKPFSPAVASVSPYTAEIAYFCDVIAGKTENCIAPPSDTVKTMRLIEALRQSADCAGKIMEFTM